MFNRFKECLKVRKLQNCPCKVHIIHSPPRIHCHFKWFVQDIIAEKNVAENTRTLEISGSPPSAVGENADQQKALHQPNTAESIWRETELNNMKGRRAEGRRERGGGGEGTTILDCYSRKPKLITYCKVSQRHYSTKLTPTWRHIHVLHFFCVLLRI